MYDHSHLPGPIDCARELLQERGAITTNPEERLYRPNEVEKTLVQIEKLVRQVRAALREQSATAISCGSQSISTIPDWP